MRRFVYKQEYVRPDATRVSDGVVVRMGHVYEVDPELMGQHFDQQTMPAWDTQRIVEGRNDHLNWMHEHFADETLVAGLGARAGPRPRPAERRGLSGADGGAGPAPKADPPLGRVTTDCAPVAKLELSGTRTLLGHRRGRSHRTRDASHAPSPAGTTRRGCFHLISGACRLNFGSRRWTRQCPEAPGDDCTFSPERKARARWCRWGSEFAGFQYEPAMSLVRLREAEGGAVR